MSRRMVRVNKLLRAELSNLILNEVKDPRIESLLTVTEVDTSWDFKEAAVYVSIMGSVEEQQSVLKGLNSARGFMKFSLRDKLRLRYIPELNFILDDSIERGARLSALIDQV